MSAELFADLAALVGADHVRTDSDSLSHYGGDRSRLAAAQPSAVVLPGSCAEVQSLVQLANARQLAIVPSGGRTGLSGGALAAKGEIVLSLQRLNRLVSLNVAERSLCVGAGTVTAEVQRLATAAGLFYPVDFASSGSSQIGGNVATNAGGIRVLRYGMTREQVRGLKVVTGSGELLDLNRGLIKNNCGPDLRHVFVGSEGILGVICEVTLALQSPPPEAAVMVLGVGKSSDLLALLAAAQEALTLSAFEFFDQRALQQVTAHSDLQTPLSNAAPWYVLLEFDVTPDSDQRASDFFNDCQRQGWLSDGVIAHTLQQAKVLWRLREDISDSLVPERPFKHDVAVTLSACPILLPPQKSDLKKSFPPVCRSGLVILATVIFTSTCCHLRA